MSGARRRKVKVGGRPKALTCSSPSGWAVVGCVTGPICLRSRVDFQLHGILFQPRRDIPLRALLVVLGIQLGAVIGYELHDIVGSLAGSRVQRHRCLRPSKTTLHCFDRLFSAVDGFRVGHASGDREGRDPGLWYNLGIGAFVEHQLPQARSFD